MSEQRRLAAIVAADVAGYSRLMGRDEAGTLARLRAHRKERFDPILARRGGRLVKLTGDGVLAEFPSAVEAVAAAIEFQQAVADANRHESEDQAIVFRIGVHLGDLIVEGDDLYGDGVNVAARLEAEAPTGGVVVSYSVRDAVDGRLKAALRDLGDLALKNIERPMRAFRVEWNAGDWRASATAPAAVAPASDAPLALPDKPSIAVLPFTNMSGDPEQEYFADGMTEDILTALSRFRGLFVIARNSSFTYKGRAVDIKRVGAELGVRYVLEGSVRSAGDRIRVTAQLIEAASGHHVWAERYDRRVDDIFDVQDEVTARIVSAIDFEVGAVEARRPPGTAGADLGVWSAYHRGFPLLFRPAKDSNRVARDIFDGLIASHPGFAPAYAASAFARTSDWMYEWDDDEAACVDRAVEYGRRAIELDDGDAFAHLALGRSLLVARERDLGVAEIEKGVARNANLGVAHYLLGVGYMSQGRAREAIASLDLAARLSPRDVLLWAHFMFKALCHSFLGEHDRAIDCARRSLAERADTFMPHVTLALALLDSGRIAEARESLAKARERRPDLSTATTRMLRMPFVPDAYIAETLEKLRGLGLPT